jgi:Domain of unknown function (DUF4964)
MKKFAGVLVSLLGFVSVANTAMSQQRVPATPLITHDPYFSIWSTTDLLTDSETTHWTGSVQSLTGVANIDGKRIGLWAGTQNKSPR